MVSVALRFPAGRFHATPWGRHVNEGAPEWPPSPWRLLRSLIAVWKIRHAELADEAVQPILEALAAPPLFSLPPASLAHTRHYMPLGLKKNVEQRTKVFDAFVAVDRASEVRAEWPDAELTVDQRATLAGLLELLGYLGRAESWCEARLLDSAAGETNCRPLDDQQPPSENEEIVRVLCADPDNAFSDDQVRAKKGRPVYEPAWNIAIETGQLHREKWSDPPGSRWVRYVRQADCFHASPRRSKRRTTQPPVLHVARYALDSNVLPLATETLPLAEHVRAALMGRMPKEGEDRRKSAVFSGKDADGRPLEGHEHAFYLPTDEDGDGRLDHVTVFAPMGFGEDEVRAIDRLRSLRSRDEEQELRLLLLAIAGVDQLDSLPLRCARKWVSATPFICTRHPKKSGARRDPAELLADPKRFIERVLGEELARFADRTGCPLPDVELLLDDAGVFRSHPRHWRADATGPQRRALEFKRFRSRKKSDDGGRRLSGFFRLHFPEAVRGPIALGHSSHFGMGLFLPDAED